MNEDIKKFFDDKSSSWDQMESSSKEERREFLSFLDIKEGDKVLDLGCGTGVITPSLLERTKTDITALDLSPKMIEIAKGKFKNEPLMHFQSGDYLEFEGKEFDWIIVFNAYPHFLDVEAFKKKTLFLLKTGGKLAIVHNLGRVDLTKHHSGSVHVYSRDLEDPTTEANVYKPEMKILLADESSSSFRIVLEKI